MTVSSHAATDSPGPSRSLPRRHATRLRHYWQTRGWACHDNIDLDLLRWGLIDEIADVDIASRFLLTAAGRDALGEAVADNRRARSRHTALVDATAQRLTDAGRLVFTELSVHTERQGRWAPCKPDVFSITRSLRPDHLVPQVHEIKVTRADLLGELRSGKIERYREMASELFLVIAAGIAAVDEIPTAYGVIVCDADGRHSLARGAPCQACWLETRHWMAMARSQPVSSVSDSPQLSF